MDSPLLSICIPTYNRAGYIRDCLDSIISQFTDPEMQKRVEIVISDNASSDNTTEVVKEYQAKYPTILYSRSETNLGFDRNFLNVINHAQGKYCFSIGDDDAFLPGSIAYLLKELEGSNIPFYGINSWGYDNSLITPVLPHPALSINNKVHYEKLSEYVRSIKKLTNIVGGFVGLSHVFLRDPWIAYPHKEQYIGTLAIHMHVLLSIYKDSPYTLLPQPVIKTRSSNIRWDVFAGLETIKGRLHSTIETTNWMKGTFNLPLSKTRIYIYFYIREYWFTFKEVIKRILTKHGGGSIITIYRKMR